MKTLGFLIALPLIVMAAIPFFMGAVIFAPVILLLAFLCVWAENRRESNS